METNINWSLEDTTTSKKYFAYINEYKIGCIVLNGGILYCYSVINDEIQWNDTLYFICLDDFVCQFDKVPKDILAKMFKESEIVLRRVISDLIPDNNCYDNYNYDDKNDENNENDECDIFNF